MLLKTEEVVSGYGKIMVVQGMSIHIDNEEIVTIIGPNGSGKSTFIKTIFGLIKPTEGTILFEDTDMTGLRSDEIMRLGIGYVPQLDNIFPTLTVRENLEMGVYSKKDTSLEETIGETLELFPLLKDRGKDRASNLSGGQRQMLAVARALVAKPKLLLLDEPSSSLAPNLVGKVLERVVEIRDLGTSILLVEQNARKALQVSDRGYVMVMGKKAYEGTAWEILNHKEIGQLYLGRKARDKRKKGAD